MKHLFPNPSWLVRRNIQSPKTCSNIPTVWDWSRAYKIPAQQHTISCCVHSSEPVSGVRFIRDKIYEHHISRTRNRARKNWTTVASNQTRGVRLISVVYADIIKLALYMSLQTERLESEKWEKPHCYMLAFKTGVRTGIPPPKTRSISHGPIIGWWRFFQ